MFRNFCIIAKSYTKRQTYLNNSIFFHRILSNSTATKKMAENVQKDFYILPNDTPVVPLDCTEAFENLNDQEKKYAHRIGKACAEGSIISFFQVSAESPAMFAILHQIFTAETAEEVKARALASGWNEDEFTAFLVYAASFLANCGNYKSFGDTKFIPNVDQTKLTKLFEGSKAFSNTSNREEEKRSLLWTEAWQKAFDCHGKCGNLKFALEKNL